MLRHEGETRARLAKNWKMRVPGRETRRPGERNVKAKWTKEGGAHREAEEVGGSLRTVKCLCTLTHCMYSKRSGNHRRAPYRRAQ